MGTFLAIMPGLSWAPKAYDHPTNMGLKCIVNKEIRSALLRQVRLQSRKQPHQSEFPLPQWLSPTTMVISCLNVNTTPQPSLTATKPRQLWFAISAWHSYVETSWLLPKLMNLGCSYLQQLKNLLLKAFDHFSLTFINWTVTRDDGISLNRQLNQRH